MGFLTPLIQRHGGRLAKPDHSPRPATEDRVRPIPFQTHIHFEVAYKGVTVGEYIPNLLCFDKIVVDTKTIDGIDDNTPGEMLNYLRVTGREAGIILNLKLCR